MPATSPLAASLASLLSERSADPQTINHARVLAMYQDLARSPQQAVSEGGTSGISHW